MSDVFISYARADQTVAARVANALRVAGHDVWWDAELPAHRAYSDIIEAKLAEAKAVVVLWSRTAVKSQWVRAEADVARNAGTLVQANIDGTLPPLPFNQIQCADLKGWRGKSAHEGWTKVKHSVDALVSGEVKPTISAPQRRSVDLLAEKRWWIAGALLLIIAAIGLLLYFRAAADDRKPVLAVLPFESLAARDESLVAGIWEDTRQLLSRNPQLLVLGPHTSQELAKESSAATRKAADYVLEGTVRTAGDRIKVSANLVRTEDGVQLWSETFDRRLDDVFELQATIASEIEGKIRGRLARGGGVKPENIATSGETYALYSAARATVRKRDMGGFVEARRQLQQVVKMDPNFAPGWATLAVVTKFDPSAPTEMGPRRDEPEALARRAIALAPNLAAGHAALGFALGNHGPVAEAVLRRAVKLDPNDIESLNWLAATLVGREKSDEKLKLYDRIVEIEPLWWPAILNRLNLLLERGDVASAELMQASIKQLGAENLSVIVGMNIASSRGDLSVAARIGLTQLRSSTGLEGPLLRSELFDVLMQLGLPEEARRVSPAPPFGPALWKNDPRGLDMVENSGIPPRKFFSLTRLTMNAGRVYLLSGRGSKLAELIHSVASTPTEMAAVTASNRDFIQVAPFLALALRATGDEKEAMAMLAKAETFYAPNEDRTTEMKAYMARIYAVQGRHDEAIALLIDAVNRNWLPRPPEMMIDIALDPALAALRTDPRFIRVREQILRYVGKERAELGQVTVDSSGRPWSP